MPSDATPMIAASIPIDEARRLFALRRLRILDTPPEPAFDHITRLAQQIYDVPMALISLIDSDRQWFKSRVGVDVTETPRDAAFCAYTIQGDAGFIVTNAATDLRFQDNPLVTGSPHIRAYGGVPLHAPNGERIGALCVADTREREFTDADMKPLRALAELAESLLQRSDDLLRLAYYDACTGLPNRQLLTEKIALLISHANALGIQIAVHAIGLDDAHAITRGLGHEAGKFYLKTVAKRISTLVASRGTVGHDGDHEMLVIQPLQDHSCVDQLTRELLASIAEPVTTGRDEIVGIASIGTAIYPRHGNDATTLLHCAGIALASARNAGRNIACHFDMEEQNENAEAACEPQSDFQRIRELRTALARGEFELYYQPEIDLRSGAVIGAEALLRWNHPRLGLLGPADFIDLAEESGLIIPIGEWVLQAACLEARRWLDHGAENCSVAVNLSALQFQRPGLDASIAQALSAASLQPQLLELELTESTLLADTPSTLARLQQLKQTGVRLAIDDFGTGYSNLAYLRRFAPDRLKVDQSFVRHMHQRAEDLAIVRAIIQLARNLNLNVLAEGVEDIEQLEQLRDLGCHSAQGYLISRPLPAATFRQFLQNTICTETSTCV
jgi:diguanylate cyclase (GGDEF)-like protein